VLNGAVRDVDRLRFLDIGVKALGANPMKSAKSGAGQADVDIVLGAAGFSTGDWVYCDSDGVVVASTPLHLRPAG
jgi:regulator of ribonuclease activity A